MEYFGATNVGKKRENNEDAFCIVQRKNAFVACVADGMGGHANGEVASGTIVSMLKKLRLLGGANAVRDSIHRTLQVASDIINKDLLGGGSTVVTMMTHSESTDDVFIESCGDSRVYLIRGHTITQITQDDSVVADYVRRGMMTPQEAKTSPFRNTITNHIGINPSKLVIHQISVKVNKTDIIILCSDGLTGELTDGVINAIVQFSSGDCKYTVEKLIKAANAKGGKDNITVVMCRF